jgi:hypothetical protein
MFSVLTHLNVIFLVANLIAMWHCVVKVSNLVQIWKLSNVCVRERERGNKPASKYFQRMTLTYNLRNTICSHILTTAAAQKGTKIILTQIFKP